MTTDSDTAPGTDRSNPPCWTTSVCPRATTASTAANGSMPSKDPRLTLVGATTALSAKSRTTATRMVSSPRDSWGRGSRDGDTGFA